MITADNNLLTLAIFFSLTVFSIRSQKNMTKQRFRKNITSCLDQLKDNKLVRLYIVLTVSFYNRHWNCLYLIQHPIMCEKRTPCNDITNSNIPAVTISNANIKLSTSFNKYMFIRVWHAVQNDYWLSVWEINWLLKMTSE